MAASPDKNRTYVGDPSQRVTVPLPQTLQELQNSANRHFGHKGPLKMYHQGEKQVTGPHHMPGIHHDDVVVVTWGRQKPPEGFKPVTTHMADYVKHPLDQRRQQGEAPIAGPKIPFEGKSSYAWDYVKHPHATRGPAGRPADAWQPTDAPTGDTTYKSHYIKHPHEMRAPPTAPPLRVDPLPFEGKSSYTRDFIRHAIDPAASVGPPRDGHSLPNAPFEDTTTYKGDYVPQKVRPRSAMKPNRPQSVPLAFQGNSEYRHEYIEKKNARRNHLHIEPAHHLTGAPVATAR